MAINTTPTHTKSGQISWVKLTTANTATNGTGTVWTLFTAWNDWARVEKIRIRHLGTNVQTVLRIFINNGGATTTPENNTLFAELTIPSNSLSQTAQSINYELPQILGFTSNPTDISSFPIVLPSGYKLLATIWTTIASWIQVTAVWGNLTA